jgi:hypothetical protein
MSRASGGPARLYPECWPNLVGVRLWSRATTVSKPRARGARPGLARRANEPAPGPPDRPDSDRGAAPPVAAPGATTKAPPRVPPTSTTHDTFPHSFHSTPIFVSPSRHLSPFRPSNRAQIRQYHKTITTRHPATATHRSSAAPRSRSFLPRKPAKEKTILGERRTKAATPRRTPHDPLWVIAAAPRPRITSPIATRTRDRRNSPLASPALRSGGDDAGEA